MTNTTRNRRTWTDEQLAQAIQQAWSWRGVLRGLELKAHGADYVKREAARLGLDTSHLGSPLRCTDDKLASVLASSASWPQVLGALGLRSGSQRCRALVAARAERLSLDTAHLGSGGYNRRRSTSSELIPQPSFLRDAAEPLAVAWFMLHGLWPAAPAEPRPYDLLLDTPDGVKRVQVKTTTSKASSGAWLARIGRHAGGGSKHNQRAPYTESEVDLFLIADGDLTLYLIPLVAVSGRTSICLTQYGGFEVGSARSVTLGNSSSRAEPLFRPASQSTSAALLASGPEGAPKSRHVPGVPPSPLKPARTRVPPRWPEEELRAAVKDASSWADLLRAFGFNPSSTKPRLALQRDVLRFGIDTSHFVGKRTWSDQALIDAAPVARTWSELCQALGLSGRTRDYKSVQRAARRLGLRLDHFALGPKAGREAVRITLPVRIALDGLTTAAPSIAAAWFLFCGCEVSAPIAPASYDLVVSISGALKRVQVKSTTCRDKRASWVVRVGHRPQGSPLTTDFIPYDVDDVDLFFIVDGDLLLYLIPLAAVAGKASLYLRAYSDFIVGDASSLLECRNSTATANDPPTAA
ncbi:MAG: hypothetical protein J2P28_08650 [Actinobacteria bacterium]|nr:hypothetical protein [Actinomycetota bacterium]MBO0835573.1 hypothetical protein [Actinomycetota bacterium]